jgi:septum formation protein
MLILASASPRRAELLRNAGIEFAVQPAHVPELRREGEAPIDFARRVAVEKACAIAALRPQDPVLAADTIVIVGEHDAGNIHSGNPTNHMVLGKPRDSDDAFAMLCLLSGRWHEVTTAVCLVVPDPDIGKGNRNLQSVAHETTRVQFAAISHDEIRAYIATGEPMDKAGAYAIQGGASRWIPRIEGCYFNVVGLPVPLVYRMLRERGVLR